MTSPATIYPRPTPPPRRQPWSLFVGVCALVLYLITVGALRIGLLPGPAAFVLVGSLLTWLTVRHLRAGAVRVRGGDVILGLCIAAASVMLSTVFTFDTTQTASTVPGVWVAALLLPAAVLEELVLRGHLLFPLSESTRVGAVLLTSALFGLLHLQYGIGGVFYFTAVGALLAAIALHRKNVRAAVVAHLLLNAMALVALLHAAD